MKYAYWSFTEHNNVLLICVADILASERGFYCCCVYYMLMQSGLLSLTFDIALSHWCIFNRSYAEQIVATWKNHFDKSDINQKIPLLYLANDILQNSKRNGNEFVIEFWKVLPAALKDVIAKKEDRGERAVSRLVSPLL
jgi:hypothetical protein